MNKFFDNFYNYKGFGPAIKAITPTEEILCEYKHQLPERLLEYWRQYGFCGWGSGIFWTVNPSEYSDVLKAWLEGVDFDKKERDENYNVIGLSAFGEIIVWGKESGNSIDINSVYGMIFPSDNTDKLAERGEERMIDLYYAVLNKENLDLDDVNEQPLFERAVERLGPLENGEIYGFVPAIALGGEPQLENLQKVKATEHLAFLAELGEKRVMTDIVTLAKNLPHNQ
ncbi:glutamyl-tRNA amidotransferase [Pseudoalteromonas sp. HM-SA03]|uniref:GAD-like domain-containing protein n=1 Tax=Pseudoalteromonas sp. HM-SA03 TaxID=2029678 RepID=UPI000BADE75C|nr:GAD-like domain-containing protein [Pseudoalteromonas sp. HM-SA03]PAY01127.1 glutamyl-tRNA amidotransferase [Pseudoalteromonas sp. HM-SA03]